MACCLAAHLHISGKLCSPAGAVQAQEEAHCLVPLACDAVSIASVVRSQAPPASANAVDADDAPCEYVYHRETPI